MTGHVPGDGRVEGSKDRGNVAVGEVAKSS
jgi:hypothetical protein